MGSLYYETYEKIEGEYAIVGNEHAIAQLVEWFQLHLNASKKTTSNKDFVAVVSGHSGVGKLSTVRRLAKKFDFHLNEFNTTNKRGKAWFEQQLTHCYQSQINLCPSNGDISISKKRIILCITEADSDFNCSLVADYIKAKKILTPLKIPIILICANCLDSCFTNVVPKLTPGFFFKPLAESHLHVICHRFFSKHYKYTELHNQNILSITRQRYGRGSRGIKLRPNMQLQTSLVKECNGDARYLLNQLHFQTTCNDQKSINKRASPTLYMRESKRVRLHLWEIYEYLTQDHCLDDIIYATSCEQLWVINGVYENYHRIPDLSIEDSLCLIDCLCIGDQMEARRSLPEQATSVSVLPFNIFAKRSGNPIDTNQFMFPSFFGRMSNNKIIASNTKNVLSRMGFITSDFTYRDFFKSVFVEGKLCSTVGKLPRGQRCTHATEWDECAVELKSLLDQYSLSTSDVLILIRPNVFNSKDLRTNFGNAGRRLLSSIE